MAESATITAPAPSITEDVDDPFKAQLFGNGSTPEPAPAPAPTPEPAPEPKEISPTPTPAPQPTPEPAPTPAPNDSRPRDEHGRFLPKEGDPEPTPEPKPEPAPEPKEDLLGKLSRGEIDNIPAKQTQTNPGLRPEEDTEEYKTWREQANALKEARKELEAARAQIKEIQGKVPTDYEDLQKRLQEVQAREAARDVRMRPEFQQEVAIPIKNIVTQIQNTIKDRGFSKAKIGEIIQIDDDIARDSALNEYLSTGDNPLPSTTIARIALSIERLREYRAHGDEIIKNAPQILESLKAEEEDQKRRSAEEEKQLYAKGKDLVFQVFDLEFGDIMKNEKSRQLIEDAANRDWNTLKPGQRAVAMAAPAMLQAYQAHTAEKIADYERRLTDSAKETASLRLQLQRLGSGGPSVEPTPTPSPQEDPNGDPFAAKLLGR